MILFKYDFQDLRSVTDFAYKKTPEAPAHQAGVRARHVPLGWGSSCLHVPPASGPTYGTNPSDWATGAVTDAGVSGGRELSSVRPPKAAFSFLRSCAVLRTCLQC